jgi:hypothetical protein
MSEHTPGPWTIRVDPLTHEPEPIVVAENGLLCSIAAPTLKGDRLADANLISAAPDLLEACRYALMTIETRLKHRKDLFTDDEINVLRKAIRKAEGGQE